jgi:hypothetical protein
MPQSSDVFDIKRLVWVVAIGSVALLGAAYLMIFGDPDPDLTAGANAFSTSAIGHAGFVELLGRLGVPSFISRGHSLEKAKGNALLVIAEPDDDDIGHHLLQQLRDVPAALVILPKRRGEPDPRHPTWVASSDLVATEAIDGILHDIDPSGKIARKPGDLVMPSTKGLKVNLSDPQLIQSDIMTPLISRDAKDGSGILLGKIYLAQAQIWVLSDPDLIANHGLGKGDNAAVAVDMIRQAMPAGGTVLFDEVIHGFAQEANLLKGLLHPPLIVASVAALLTLLALLLCASPRFGSPRKFDPILAAGKLTLISNAAALLATSDRRTALSDRYLRIIFADLAQHLGATRVLDDAAVIDWLDQHAARQGITRSATAMLRTASSSQLSTGALMRQIQNWTREMTNGISGSTGIRSIDRHAHQG